MAEVSLTDRVFEPLEDALDKMGLMQGDFASVKRAALGGAAGYAVMSVWKPGWAYDKDGKPYPWSVTADPKIPKDSTTQVPYWMAALIPAVVLGVLI